MKGFHFWQFIAGITVFVYAMLLIESSLKNLAGRSFKKFLQKQSRNKLKMMAASTVVTAFLQSSSIVLLMVLSFVGAGLMNMRGALAAVLGANLGTTLDSWVIAIIGFKINFNELSFPILGISLLGLLLSKKNSLFYYLTTFLIGFAFVFIALEWLKSCVDQSLENYLGTFSTVHYLFFIPIGFVITAVIQSSSVTIAITLAALFNHVIPFESAAAIVIGSELGTTIKFLISSIGGMTDKKRVAWGNFILNLATLIIASSLLHPLVYLIKNVLAIEDNMLGLVAFQSGINLFSILLFYPFLGVMADSLERVFKERAPHNLTLYIHKTDAALSTDSLEMAERETIHLINQSIELNRRLLGIDEEQNRTWMKSIWEFTSGSFYFSEAYNKMKQLEGEILEFITKIPKNELTEKEIEKTGKLINVIRHILRAVKNLKDIRHNLDEFESSVNDTLFNLFMQNAEKEREFYNKFQLMLNETGRINALQLDELIIQNRKRYDDAIAIMLSSLREKKISELDSSNLLNVYREIYSSNKALIRALADIKDMDAEGL